MIAQNYKSSDIEGDDFEGIDASIDKSNLSFLFDIVSKQMYRRPINSIVREITSNCFDSHIEAGVDDPVIIILKHDEGGDYIIFKDVGIGMSPQRMKSIYSKYFSSTKRDSNDQIGMFGLGSKSPLSYTDLFYLTTNYNGKKYEYQIHTGKKTPRIDLLIEDDTLEHNGTEVKIYIKNSLDVSSFVAACKSELVYFDNVYIDSYYEFDNEYTILEYKTFKYRPNSKYSGQLHLIIGKVPYPISWDEIGLNPINIPCGLKFEIGDLQVTPERESIRYIDIVKTDEIIISTKEIIINKINDFKKEIEELHNKNLNNIFEDYQEYLIYQEQQVCRLELDKDIWLDITSIIKKPEGIFEPLKDFIGRIPKNLFFEYETTTCYKKNGRSTDKRLQVSYNTLRDILHLIPSKSGKVNRKKLEYLYHKAHDLTGNSYFYLVISRRDRNLKQVLQYLDIEIKSDKCDYSKTNATRQLKLYRDFVEREFKRLTFVMDDIQIDQEWLHEYNLANKAKVNKEDNSFLVYNYGNFTLAEKEYKTIEELRKFTGFIIYGFEENEELIRNFRILLSNSKYGDNKNQIINSKQCRLYKTAQRNYKHLSQLKNAIFIENFMGNNKIFKRFATAAMIENDSKAIKLKGYINKELDNFPKLMEEIFPPVADTINDLTKACIDYGNVAYTKADSKISIEFFNDMVSVAKEHNLYDKEMLDAHEKLERYVAGLDLINYIACKDEVIPYLVDFLKLKNKKVGDIWNNIEEYESSLINESLERISYLLSIYLHSEYYYRNESFQDKITYIRKERKDGFSEKEVNTKISSLQKIGTIYKGLLNYQTYGNQTRN